MNGFDFQKQNGFLERNHTCASYHWSRLSFLGTCQHSLSSVCLHQSHFQAALRVVRYLKSCPGKGIFFSRTSSFQLSGFSDADWPMCVDTRHSITGSSLVSWKTKEQFTVSRSFAETEYRALTSTTSELQWLVFLLQDLQVSLYDNLLYIVTVKAHFTLLLNPCFLNTHLENDCHLVWEKLLFSLMNLLPVSSLH